MGGDDMKIISPKNDESHPDYVLACEEALDRPVREMVDMAINAGWKPEAVYTALSNVTTAQILAYDFDPDPADDPA